MPQRFALFVTVAVCLALVLQASVGPPICFHDNQTGPANFSWGLSNLTHAGLIVVVNPRGDEVFFFNGDKNYSVSSSHSSRITNVKRTEDRIQFSLINVTKDDEGNYTCRDGAPSGPVIPNCGQTLHFIEGPNQGDDIETTICGNEGPNQGGDIETTTSGNDEPETSSTPASLLWLLFLLLLLVPVIGAIIILCRRNKASHQPVSTVEEYDLQEKH